MVGPAQSLPGARYGARLAPVRGALAITVQGTQYGASRAGGYISVANAFVLA
jgi:hypothetical protein